MRNEWEIWSALSPYRRLVVAHLRPEHGTTPARRLDDAPRHHPRHPDPAPTPRSPARPTPNTPRTPPRPPTPAPTLPAFPPRTSRVTPSDGSSIVYTTLTKARGAAGRSPLRVR